ncbi:MAG: hypothetical protein KF895_03300 [Parvibaculum sp.]|nr:hypothetical protein [Parvibaculum sp.]
MTNPRDKAIEAAAKAVNPDLFSDDPVVAHRAASPFTVEAARKPVIDALTRAIAAYEREMWRPIEEAAKEWTPILVFDPAFPEGETVQVAAWNDIGEYWQSWIDDAPDPDPTHFRPLPTVPEGE